MASRKNLEQWIKEARTDIDKEDAIRALQLIHKVGAVDEEIHTTRLGGNRTDKELAEMFQNKAETFAQGLSGMQTFAILAFYGSSNNAEARFPFMVRGKLDFEEEGNATEEPTEKGQRQQGMRLLEIIAQQSYREREALVKWQHAMIDRLATHNLALQQENREAFDIVKEMMLKESTRQAENQMAIMKFQRETAERAKWMKLLPALANNILGREIFPRDTEDTALVESVIEKLGEGDMQKLAQALPSEIFAPLIARSEKYWKEQRAITAEAKRLAETFEATPAEARKELNS